jgi:hypothetical protein
MPPHPPRPRPPGRQPAGPLAGRRPGPHRRPRPVSPRAAARRPRRSGSALAALVGLLLFLSPTPSRPSSPSGSPGRSGRRPRTRPARRTGRRLSTAGGSAPPCPASARTPAGTWCGSGWRPCRGPAVAAGGRVPGRGGDRGRRRRVPVTRRPRRRQPAEPHPAVGNPGRRPRLPGHTQARPPAPRAVSRPGEALRRTCTQPRPAPSTDCPTRPDWCWRRAGPGERPAAAAPLGRTAFGYYVEQGVRGAADGWNDAGDRDGRVTAAELAAFVRARVGRWATDAGGRPQTPTLSGNGGDFTLRSGVSSAPVEEGPTVGDPPAYPDWLLAGWKTRDQWLDAGRAATAPRAVQHLEAALIGAETALEAGTAAADVQRRVQDAVPRLDALAGRLAGVRSPEPLPTLAAARASLPPADPPVVEELKAVLARADAGPAPAAAPTPAPAPAPPVPDALKGKPHEVVAAAVWDCWPTTRPRRRPGSGGRRNCSRPRSRRRSSPRRC